jgi:hypothetical protein
MKHHIQQNKTKLMPTMMICERKPPIAPQCVEKQHQKNRSQCASELTQQINDSKPSPHCKEVAIKTMHTTTMCNDIAEDKCNIKKQVEMNITGKYFAYLVEFPSSKKKLVSLRPFNESRKMSMHCAFGYRQSNLGYGIVKLRMHLMMEQ